jgi:hypothetical protein
MVGKASGVFFLQESCASATNLGRMANMNYFFFEVALTLYFIDFNE